MKVALILSVSAMLILQQVSAQVDPHFTQNYIHPTYINPAMVGQSEGDYRVSASYRNQWSAMGNPYRTTGLSADANTNSNLALGLNILNQSAGDVGYNYFNAYASIAYTGVKFGKNENHHIIFAMQAGILNRHVDQSKFKWDEQWNPSTGYSASNPYSESFNKTSATALDIATGVTYYDASTENKLNAFGGVSFYHINKPGDPIVSAEGTQENTIPMRYSAHGGINIILPAGAKIIPHVLYNQQGSTKELMVGIYGQKTVNEETAIMAGAYYRTKDAIAPCIGVEYKNFLVAASYDANVSQTGAMTRSMNSFELSFTYIMKRKNGIGSSAIHPRL